MKKIKSIISEFSPRNLLHRIWCLVFLKKHKYPPTTLVRRKLARIVYEIDFCWYDTNFDPVWIMRELKTNKTYSASYIEMTEFTEYTEEGAGSTIPMQTK